MRQVESAARSIGEHATADLIVINKSTVPIGTGDLVSRLVGERIKPGMRFSRGLQPRVPARGLGPGRLHAARPRRARRDRPRGRRAGGRRSTSRSTRRSIITDLRTAEMIKYASNAFLATRISFINEIAQICERLGADVKRGRAGHGPTTSASARSFLDAGHRLRRLLLPQGCEGAGPYGRPRTTATRNCSTR